MKKIVPTLIFVVTILTILFFVATKKLDNTENVPSTPVIEQTIPNTLGSVAKPCIGPSPSDCVVEP